MTLQRPGVLTAGGIMCIIFGSLQAISIVYEILVLVTGMSGQEVFRQRAPGYTVVTLFNLASETAEVIAILFAGIGLLKMRPWSRALAIPTLIWIIIRTIAYTTYTLVFVMPLMGEVFDQQLARQGLKKGQGPDIGGLVSGLTGVCVGGMAVLWVIYHGVVLYLISKPRAIRALKEGGVPVEPMRRDDEYESRPRDDYEDGWDVRRPADQPPDDRFR